MVQYSLLVLSKEFVCINIVKVWLLSAMWSDSHLELHNYLGMHMCVMCVLFLGVSKKGGAAAENDGLE